MTVMTDYTSDYIHDIISRDDNDILILQSLGLHPDAYGNLKSPCIIHDGDNAFALTYKSSIKKWACWTNHCEKNYGSDLIGLVRGIRGCSFEEAKEYIVKVTNSREGMQSSQSDIDRERKLFIKEKLQPLAENYDDVVLADNVISNTDYNVDYFIKERGFLPETLKDFGAFYCNNIGKSLYGRACVTIRNDKNQIVGFTGRKTKSIDKTDSNKLIAKWFHAPKNIRTGNHLFGLNLVKYNILNSKVCVLVEGPLDVMRLYESGIKIAVSPFGTKFSTRQKDLLLKYGVRTCIILFDRDEGGDCGTLNLIQTCRLYFNTIDARHLLDNDPGDSTIANIQSTVTPFVNKIINEDLIKYGN